MAIVAPATPVFWELDPVQLVERVMRSVESVLDRLPVAIRATVREELAAWRAWIAGAASDARLRLSARVVREALDEGGRHDLAAACVAVAAQTVETVGRIDSADTESRRRALLWSARLSAERAVQATRLVRTAP